MKKVSVNFFILQPPFPLQRNSSDKELLLHPANKIAAR